MNKEYIKLKDRLKNEPWYTDKIFKIVDEKRNSFHGTCYVIDDEIYFDVDDRYYNYTPTNWAKLLSKKEVREAKLKKLI